MSVCCFRSCIECQTSVVIVSGNQKPKLFSSFFSALCDTNVFQHKLAQEVMPASVVVEMANYTFGTNQNFYYIS